MSAYYGTLKSDKGKTTRAGHHWIIAAAQSWQGSATVRIEDGRMRLQVAEGSQIGGRTVLDVAVEDLVGLPLLEPELAT